MTPEAQRIAIAESCGILDIWEGLEGRVHGYDSEGEWVPVPNYPSDRNAIHAALLHHGIQSHDNPAIRVRFIGFLREIASRRLPRNKSGASLMSDVDLVTCEAWELCEALLKTLKLYKP